MRLREPQAGSIPLALLASIVVAGLITALVSMVVQSERTVRFDRSFTNVIQTADAGVQEAYHQLSAGLIDMEISDPEQGPFTVSNNEMEAEWWIDRITERAFEVTSIGEAADGTRRKVVTRIEKDALFFPGAFGETLVGLQGQSTQVDSYESGTVNCSGNTDTDRCWGYPEDNPYGTEKAALGTNGDFRFTGNVESVRRAILYDWEDNPPAEGSVTEANPGGSRCDGSGADDKNPCNPEVIRTVGKPLEYGSDQEMQFIHDKLAACSDDQWLGTSGLDGVSEGTDITYVGGSKKNDPPAVLEPYSTAAEDNEGSPADDGWNNYWCAEAIQVRGDVDVDATPDAPVVIFVQDSYSQASHRHVNWPGDDKTNFNQRDEWRSERPKASTLQLFVASDRPAGTTANVSIANQAVFGGVVHAPRSICSGESSSASANVYGALICRTVQNVGNWKFHYDETLGQITRDTFSVATWREEDPDDAA